MMNNKAMKILQESGIWENIGPWQKTYLFFLLPQPAQCCRVAPSVIHSSHDHGSDTKPWDAKQQNTRKTPGLFVVVNSFWACQIDSKRFRRYQYEFHPLCFVDFKIPHAKKFRKPILFSGGTTCQIFFI